MVVPLNLEKGNSKKHHHRSHHFNSLQFVDLEEAAYVNRGNHGGSDGNNRVIEAADGVDTPKSNDNNGSRPSSRSSSKKYTVRHTFGTTLTSESASSCCKCILLPHGETRTCWDLYICLLLIYVGAFVPYRVSFLGELDGIMEAVEMFVDISFCIDIIINFFTGYETTDGRVEIRCFKIARKYLKSYFILDVIATVPFDKILELLVNESSTVNGLNKAGKLTKLPRLFRIVRITKLLKILRLYRFKKWIRNVQIHYNIHHGFTKLFNIIIIVLFATHLVACLWYALGVKLDVQDSQECTDGIEEGWVCRENLVNKSSGHTYIAALYWAFSTLTTVGYGDISARSIEEQIFSMLMMLLGVSWYAYTVGSMSTILASFDKKNKARREKMVQVNTFIRETRLPPSLGNRVRLYFEFLSRKQSNGLFGYDADEILNELSAILRTEVICFVESELIKCIPFFEDKSPTFVANMIQLLKPIVVEKGEYIIKEGSASDEMYFLIHGTASVIYGEEEVKRLNEGAYFGEIGCILGGVRKASIVALSHCELRCLSRKHLNQLLGQHPSVGEDLKQVARARMKVAKDRTTVESATTTGNTTCTTPNMKSRQKKNLSKLQKVDCYNFDNKAEELIRVRKHLEGMNRKLSLTSAVIAEGNHICPDGKVFEEINQNDDDDCNTDDNQEEAASIKEGYNDDIPTDIKESSLTDNDYKRVQNILCTLNQEDNAFVQTFLIKSIVHHTKRKIIEYNTVMQEQLQKKEQDRT